MKKMLAVAIAILTLGLSSCTTFTPIAAGSGEVGARKGSATAVSIMGLPPNALLNFGNNSMLEAAKDAGVTHVATVDSRNTVILGGLVVVKTTIVTGD